jgi:hypothetical protein
VYTTLHDGYVGVKEAIRHGLDNVEDLVSRGLSKWFFSLQGSHDPFTRDSMDVTDGGEIVEEYPADTSRLAPVGDLSKPEHQRSEPDKSFTSFELRT